MTQREFEAWQDFYVQAPFDDLHRYHRPASLIAVSMSGGNVADKIEWLQPSRVDEDYSDADMKTFAAFGMKPPKR